MKKKQHKFSDLISKIRYKYRVSLINEDTFKEEWFTRLSRFSVLLFAISFFLLSFIIITLLFVVSPLHNYLPVIQETENRATFIQQSIIVDSLNKEVMLQEKYLSSLRNVILNNNLNDTALKVDTGKIYETEHLIEKSKNEIEFVKEYEKVEKYNLASIPTEQTKQSMQVFFKPVEGVVASTFQPKENKFGISLITDPQATVKSVLEGNIISIEYTFNSEWIIQVQHPNDYISIYKNNTKVLKSVGDKVKAGESIAITGTTNKHKKYFYLEIWKKGSPINPQEVITF